MHLHHVSHVSDPHRPAECRRCIASGFPIKLVTELRSGSLSLVIIIIAGLVVAFVAAVV